MQHQRFPSVVSSGLVLPPSLTSAPALAPAGAAIPHIPLSLARQHLSLITAELSSHAQQQRASLDELAASYERWQAATLTHYEAVLAAVKRRANERIQHLQLQLQQTPHATAPLPSPSPSPSVLPPAREESSTSPLPVSPALPVGPAPSIDSPAPRTPPLGVASASPLPPSSAESEAAGSQRWATAQAVGASVAAAQEAGLTSSTPLPLPSLRALLSSLQPWVEERSALASEVSSIKGQQAALQAEKLRLTEWKGRIRGGADGGSDWEEAKAALVMSGAQLKARHQSYEGRIVAYKAEEARLKGAVGGGGGH